MISLPTRLAASFLVFLLSLATADSAVAGEPPLRADFEGRAITAWPSRSGAWVEIADNPAELIELSGGFVLDSLRGSGEGYLLAGSQRSGNGDRRLFVIEGKVGEARRLPALPLTRAAIRCQPVLMADGGRLAGIAWLEGEAHDTLAVRASRWTAETWQPVETVASFAAGSQLALAGAVLNDGSWLLAWSRFDGQDDEIVASSSLGEGWSAAKRVSVDNAVPDILPALTASGNDALIAWSRYDGAHYRLMTARYRAGEWSGERVVGEKGSLFPSFSGAGPNLRLLYRTALPRTWTVAVISDEGEVLRHAKVASPGKSRPVVDQDSRGLLQLRWPGRAKADRVLEWIPGGVQ